MRRHGPIAVLMFVALAGVLAGCGSREPADPAPADEPVAGSQSAADRVHVSPASDARAIEIAQSVVESVGGWPAWDATRFVRWDFFGRRTHYWDRQTGDVRMEIPGEDGDLVVLMNVDSRQGRVFRDGVEIEDPEELATQLAGAHEMWINDSYWMFLPFKLLDPGVTLRYLGERQLEGVGTTDVLELTFDSGVGYTPDNRYEVLVARDSGLIRSWSFFAEAAQEAPNFTLPWDGWETFGGIRLATDHGRGAEWAIDVPDELPRSLFTDAGSPAS